MTTTAPSHPELLAPAGNWECAKAAVANGADAIYFGLSKFNARMRADNFTEADLPELMTWLHGHGVRGFVAMNTLIFTTELADAANQLALLQAAGVDAVIIQDLGLAALAARVAPQVELHASTQMTITSPEGLAFAHSVLRLDRAVLARELSIREIKRFSSVSMDIQPTAVPLEVFVHGALCVAYSGQCLTSEALGQRSANRGECAQACRMPYSMIVDGQPRDLGDKKYLLSPLDLAAHGQIAELLESGVTSFKIEGRLKSPEYVAAVTKVYRKALDLALAGNEPIISQADRYALEMTFSRGLSTGWLTGTNHPALVHARFGKKRGAFLGVITRTGKDWIELDRPVAAKPNDGIVIDSGGDTNAEIGGRVLGVNGRQLQFPADRLIQARPRAGDRLWKTSDPQLDSALRATWKGRIETHKQQPIALTISGGPGTPLRIIELHSGTSIESTELLEQAIHHPLDEAVLRNQFSRLGGTGYTLATIECKFTAPVILPLSALNRLRRQLVAALDASKNQEHATPGDPATVMNLLLPTKPVAISAAIPASLTVLVRNLDQLDAAIACGIHDIYADFEDIRRARDIVERVRSANDTTPRRIFLATPRIQKSGEQGFFKLLERAEPDGILLRNLGALGYFRDLPGLHRHADFSLNIANPISAKLLRDAANLDRLTISCDLNIRQVIDLLESAPANWFELSIHQHMPMFHMEHCVFCAFLSSGTDASNCGRPCEQHQVQLQDRVGMKHTLLADVGCRNTVFRGQAQTGASFLPALLKANLCHYRIELLNEDRAAAMRLIGFYQDLLSGKQNPATAWKSLKATAQLGVTEGTLGE